MALRKVSEIDSNKSLQPNSELGRINKIVANRRLYDNDFRDLRLPNIDLATPGVTINWFRRTATFYPEFMLADEPIIVITDKPRMTKAIQPLMQNIVQSLVSSNINMIRFGVGVIAPDPRDITKFKSFDPDTHFEVVDNMGYVTHDILVEMTGTATDTERRINVFVYGVDGKRTWRQFNSNAGNLGPQIASYKLPNSAKVRQVALLPLNTEQVSLFEDMKKPITEMCRVATSTARTIKRNSSPHLYGPDTMLAKDENGRVRIDTDGMFLPIQDGDPKPGYLYWNAEIEGQKWQYETMEKAALTAAGLSLVIFDPAVAPGELSGVAMLRTLIPFSAKLNQFSRINERTLGNMLTIWNANRKVLGQEIFSWSIDQLDVTWQYQAVWEDEQRTPSQDKGANPTSPGGNNVG